MEENVNFDNEVLAYLSVRKDELIQSHSDYQQQHPEIREVLNDFISSVLLHKPVSSSSIVCSILKQNDVYVYAKEYFHPFNPTPLQYKPLILVGPSGVGKKTLVREALKKYGSLFESKKSITTREKRDGDNENSAIEFVTKEVFQKMVDENQFIEHQSKLHGHRYGTSYGELKRIKDAGKIPVIEVDVQGAIDLNKMALEGNYLFIYPPSFEELRKRIGNRIEDEAAFKVRIADAIKQIELANNSVLFTNRLVNDKLDLAIDQFFTLIEALYF